MGSSTDGAKGTVDQGEANRSGPRDAKAQAPPTSANHLFANNVRFLSMAAIIAIHTMDAYPGGPVAHRYLAQLFKFETIGFFLISGFLFGERIDRYSSIGYFTRRLRSVFLPWSVWYLLTAVLASQLIFFEFPLIVRFWSAKSIQCFQLVCSKRHTGLYRT